MIKLLVVDDSPLTRTILSKMFNEEKEIEVVGGASNGIEALEKIAELNPDVVALDVNMPRMDGIECLQKIMKDFPRPVVMISSLTKKDADITFKALEYGAVDYVPKLSGASSFDLKKQTEEIILKIKAAAKAKIGGMNNILKSIQIRKEKQRASTSKEITRKDNIEIVAIGISTGGPKILAQILPLLPKDFKVPIIVVQHMPPVHTKSFANRLDSLCELSVKEAESGDILNPSNVYVAAGGYHLKVIKPMNKNNVIVRLASTPTDTLFKPSVDVTMLSILDVYASSMAAVIMTGMGNDGTKAIQKVKMTGGITIAESEETCIVYGMPRAAIETGSIDYILPNYDIPDKLISLVSK